MRSSSVSSSDSDVNRNRKSSSRSRSIHETKPQDPPTQAQVFKVRVGKLPAGVNEGHLREIFSIFGQILSIVMPSPDMVHRQSKRYAFICFGTSSSLANAVEYMNQGQLNGQVINVVEVFDSTGRERSREKEKVRKEDDASKKQLSAIGLDKKNAKIEADDGKTKLKTGKEKSPKESKPKESGRFKRKSRHRRSSSNSSDSDSSKRDSSDSSRSSSSSLSESSNSSSD